MEMNESRKTGIFAGIAVLVCAVWLIGKPSDRPFTPGENYGKILFNEAFSDPATAASLEIVSYDEELGEIRTFKVAKNAKTGLWSIPSHSDYPADAEDRIRDVATGLVGVKVLGIVTQDATEHELFGVREPDADERKLGDKGVGLLVEFEDRKGKKLASLIIGKPIKGQDGHRFVREPGQDIVYDVAVDPDRFSIKFQDWIEEDLLGINALDVEAVMIKDYSVLRTPQAFTIDPRYDAMCQWNSTDSKWELGEFNTYRKSNGPDSLTPIPSELLDGEELNKEKLDDLKSNLDKLKIVDVRRKPDGLRADLKADEGFLDNQESVNSLVNRGFYPLSVAGAEPEILSANGELHIYMKDGYEYLLRFGNVSGTEAGTDESKLNRYLLVTALLDEKKFPLPEFEEVPKKPEAADVPAPPADAEKPAEAGDEAAAGNEAAEEVKEETELEKEIKRIEKENQRKQDEWEENRGKAEQKVRELNGRFADWYYVVSEDIYKKLRLSRSDLIQEGEKTAEEGTGIDAFRKLQADGLPEKAPQAP